MGCVCTAGCGLHSHARPSYRTSLANFTSHTATGTYVPAQSPATRTPLHFPPTTHHARADATGGPRRPPVPPQPSTRHTGPRRLIQPPPPPPPPVSTPETRGTTHARHTRPPSTHRHQSAFPTAIDFVFSTLGSPPPPPPHRRISLCRSAIHTRQGRTLHTADATHTHTHARCQRLQSWPLRPTEPYDPTSLDMQKLKRVNTALIPFDDAFLQPGQRRRASQPMVR